MEKTIKELEQELIDLRTSNMAAWEVYGSELSGGEMLMKEDALQDKIDERKRKRDKIIKKWEESGLLNGLNGDFSDISLQLFECPPSSLIEDDD